MPLPKCFLSDFSFAELNSALRTASTRRQSRGNSFLYFSNHRVAAAATCGVAAEVPSPFNRTIDAQPNRAQGMFGVYAAIAAFIADSGPKLPSRVVPVRPA